jgi:hypothetical protein
VAPKAEMNSNSPQSEFGCALMSPRPNTTLADCWIWFFIRIPESIFQ